ncbi:MAG: hypothetical protein U1F52_02210 [Burkholderiales bacterium]
MPSARAQDRATAASQMVDWYYASTFGTGVYRIGDRTVSVLMLPLSHTVKAAEDGEWGVRLKLPVAAGFHSLSDPVNDVLERNIATLSAMPGIEFEREVARNWVLRPTLSAGYAMDVVSGNRSTLYEIGTRSLWTRAFRTFDFSLGNALLYAGNVAQDGVTQHLGVLSTGFNFVMPAGGVLMGRAANFGVHVVHYAFFNRLDFVFTQETRRSISQQYEVAFTVGTYRPVDVAGIEFDRIGIGLRFGEDIFAVRLVTGFLF